MSTEQKPLVWMDPKAFPDNGHACYDNSKQKPDSYIFMHGRPLPWDSDYGNPNLTTTLQDPKDYDLVYTYEFPEEQLIKYDCVPNNGQVPLVNQRTLNLLRNFCPKDFQAFPVVIRGENFETPSFENHDYHLLNITHCVDAIDLEGSEVSYFESGDVRSIKYLTLKKNCLGSHHIARITNCTTVLIVSPELVSLFKKNKIKGVRFVTDEEAYY